MLRHVFKIVWNRKKANALVAVEIFFSFVVLVGVLTMLVLSFGNVRHPLGFTSENVWSVRLDDQRGLEGGGADRPVRELVEAAAALPQVASAAAIQNVPYSFGAWISSTTLNGKRYLYHFSGASDGVKEVLGLELSRGRWFSREDDGAPYVPTVLNERAAHDLFGAADPVGQFLPDDRRDMNPDERRRVVGVLSAFRIEGPYQAPRAFAFSRIDLRARLPRGPVGLVVKVRPGTPRSFEAALVKALHGVAPAMTFTVTSLEEMRVVSNERILIPLAVGAVLSAFLMLMVALGLTGVLWESVTRRTREIGLRRAVGASGLGVAGQIVLEICAVATFGVAVGALFAGQLPILHLLGELPAAVFAAGVSLATLALYVFAASCALYPGWLATRVLPARALRDE